MARAQKPARMAQDTMITIAYPLSTNALFGKASVPGGPRRKFLQLQTLLKTPIYGAKKLVLNSRPYWPGLKSLKEDGLEKLALIVGFTLLKDECSSTALKYIPAASFPKTSFQVEHIREVNMLDQFTRSLLTGVKVSGERMKHTFDPLAIVAGWHKYYDSSTTSTTQTYIRGSFTQAGQELSKEMSYASQYIPELKNIDLAWAEWEPDFYAAAASHATNWLASRSGLIQQKFSSTGSLSNPAAVRLVLEVALLVAQSHRIKSPVAP
ncbi:predicted protein [Sclerotinia sclerotiorum 1980 UF-70]|uniref:Uncharacterized protein n=1 Tax=Sclerotinia sclerotiorum (strain ATCC 18683 / 1980 / Ss-1) TaxID=665079 RepID=A7EPY3_SCLS1|nr:predicted protein [Sclerotinia sclerotiorum 1980 UF-70]EDO04899.1 predicted protein [Sclerotinia sclerotiorum 1980 UF-70]